MSVSPKVARAKFAEVLSNIISTIEAEYEYDSTPPPTKRRNTVNYLTLSGHNTRAIRHQNSDDHKHSQQNAGQLSKPAWTPTFVLKLFDRSVDLAQFCKDNDIETDKSLYPVCRSWVHNKVGSNYQQAKTNSISTAPSSAKNKLGDLVDPNHIPIDDQDHTSEDGSHIYELPKPKNKKEVLTLFEIKTDDPNPNLKLPRLFSPPKNDLKIEDLDNIMNSMNLETCMQENKRRWKEVRDSWSKARNIYESRYEESFKILKEMFVASQRNT